MSMKSVQQAVGAAAYPGRGIVVGKSKDLNSAVIAYFIMGRSDNSRNRVFEPYEGGIRTRAHDESKMTDPSLIIYSPVRVLNDYTIVTNGDQTDTIYDALANGKTFGDALMTRTFEPDKPNYTPRISALVRLGGGDFCYGMSILKSDDGDPKSAVRAFFHYENPAPGIGRFIHTYAQDAEALISFSGEPEKVSLDGGIDELAEGIYGALDEENKVSLFLRFIDLATGETESRIINKLST